MAVSFTEDQQKVITLRNRNLLVSAAAGSGKTAVLVERIIRMITDKENPVDIDRLLVVTFTNAAAAEMRERIGLAINRLLLEDGENVHLQRQASLLHNAQITTIDSFCLFVIRNNFNDIGLDPGFRVADEGELRLLKQDVLQELLEERYQKKEERFVMTWIWQMMSGRNVLLFPKNQPFCWTFNTQGKRWNKSCPECGRRWKDRRRMCWSLPVWMISDGF